MPSRGSRAKIKHSTPLDVTQIFTERIAEEKVIDCFRIPLSLSRSLGRIFLSSSALIVTEYLRIFISARIASRPMECGRSFYALPALFVYYYAVLNNLLCGPAETIQIERHRFGNSPKRSFFLAIRRSIMCSIALCTVSDEKILLFVLMVIGWSRFSALPAPAFA